MSYYGDWQDPFQFRWRPRISQGAVPGALWTAGAYKYDHQTISQTDYTNAAVRIPAFIASIDAAQGNSYTPFPAPATMTVSGGWARSLLSDNVGGHAISFNGVGGKGISYMNSWGGPTMLGDTTTPYEIRAELKSIYFGFNINSVPQDEWVDGATTSGPWNMPPDAIGIQYEDNDFTIVWVKFSPSNVYRYFGGSNGWDGGTVYVAAAPTIPDWEPDYNGFTVSSYENTPTFSMSRSSFVETDHDGFRAWMEYPTEEYQFDDAVSADLKSFGFEVWTDCSGVTNSVPSFSWSSVDYPVAGGMEARIESPRYRYLYEEVPPEVIVGQLDDTRIRPYNTNR